MSTSLWPHQEQAIRDVLAAIAAGHRRICLTSPTGGGKTRIMCELIRAFLGDRLAVSLYTNRRMLTEQTSRMCADEGIYHGVRSAGYADEREHPFQISSIQTEWARVYQQKTWTLHPATRVLVDEAHIQTGESVQKVLSDHLEEGAAYVGPTATPIGLAELYDHLIVAGKPSDLRACCALVPAFHYGPDEPDVRHIGKVPLGEDPSAGQIRKVMMTSTIFARVLEWFGKLNPDRLPSILFAPGVDESVWFAEEFSKAGIPAASIDGSHISFGERDARGESVVYPTSQELRDQVMAGSKDGSIKVVCNRFVLREGIDAPWLRHGIFCTIFGSIQTYLQSGGRLLRAYPGKDHVTIQDHGGAWWRHGSLNEDREWNLEYTSGMLSSMRADAYREGEKLEPIHCPKCGMILARATCPCGFDARGKRKSRPVIQSDGSLKEMGGDIFRRRRISGIRNAQAIWTRMYYRARNAGMTFSQAEALFALENNWGWPDRTMKLMPIEKIDWYRKVNVVPTERLR